MIDGHQVGAHAWAKDLAELGEGKETVARLVNELHYSTEVFLVSVDLEAAQTFLKVLIRDVAIAVRVELAEKLVHLDLSIEDLVLNLVKDASDLMVVHVFILDIGSGYVLVDFCRRWISPLSLSELVWNLIVSSEDQRRNVVNIGRSICVIAEGRQESFDVSLGYLEVDHVFLDYLQDKLSQLIYRHITVFIDFDVFLELFVKICLALKFFLEATIDLNHFVFNLFDLILRHLLLVKHDVVGLPDCFLLLLANNVSETRFH